MFPSLVVSSSSKWLTWCADASKVKGSDWDGFPGSHQVQIPQKPLRILKFIKGHQIRQRGAMTPVMFLFSTHVHTSWVRIHPSSTLQVKMFMFRQDVHGSCPSSEASTTVLKNSNLITWHTTLTWHHDSVSRSQSKLDTTRFSHATTRLQVSQQNHFGPQFESSVEEFDPSKCRFIRLLPCRAVWKPYAIRFFHSRRIPRTQKMIRVNLIHKTVFEVVPTWDIPTTEIFRHMMIHLGKHDKTQRQQKTNQNCSPQSVDPTESSLHFQVQKWLTWLMAQLVQGSGTVLARLPPPIHHSHVAAWAQWLTLTQSDHSHSVKRPCPPT